MKNFRGKKWITNFPRTLSLEISQKNLSYFREKVLREIISIKLVIEKSWRKSQDKYKISEMNARLLRRSACVSKQIGDNRRPFVVEEGPPPRCAEVQQQQQCAHAYIETGSAWRTFSRTERQHFSRHIDRLSAVEGRALCDMHALLNKVVSLTRS